MPKSEGGFSALLADIAKRHGVKVGSLSDVVEPIAGLTTDNLSVDYVTGVDGLPVGRVTELYGPPSCGKTTTALQAAARFQYKIIKEGLDQYILYLDFEKALDPDYCAALGLDVDHPSFVLARPAYLEQGGEIGNELLGTGKVKLMIVDSVASMAPKALLEGDFDQRTTAMNRARLLSGWLLRLIGQLDEHDACAVFINHLMEAIDIAGRSAYLAPKETTPGGKGLKFYSSLRLRYQQIGKVKGTAEDALVNGGSDMQVATRTQVTVTKNKVGPPFRQCEVRIKHGKGFDNVWSAVQVLLAHKRITKNGAWHIVKDDKFPELADRELPMTADGKHQFHGEGALLAFAEDHAVWAERLIAAAIVLVKEHGGAPLETGDLVEKPMLEGDWA